MKPNSRLESEFRDYHFNAEKAVVKTAFSKLNTLGKIRTCDPLIRSQVLYPAELRVRKANN